MASSASGGAADSVSDDMAEVVPKSRERSKRFRFKSANTHSKSDDEKDAASKTHRHHHHSTHHRSKRRKVSPPHADDPAVSNDSIHQLPPDAAFRESLFDALGDDEGAAFWEGVYGQPIHKYASTYQDERTGKLEQMTDDEYAQYVRRKMWEKSWEGIEAAKEAKKRDRELEKQKVREEERNENNSSNQPKEAFVFDFEVEQSLKRGEQRRERKYWKGLWEEYLRRWNDLQELVQNRTKINDDSEQVFLRNKIAWPVESGKRKDLSSEQINRFITLGVKYAADNGSERDTLLDALKLERVRWHPDKVQQRYGFMNIDEETMKCVTAVFQVFDRMWNERRSAR